MSGRARFVRQNKLWWICLTSLLLCACRHSRGGGSSTPPWQEFSGKRALEQVQHIVDFGPRPPGTDAIRETRDYIAAQLQQFGWKVTRQTFSDSTPRGRVEFVNLIAHFGDEANTREQLFLLCSHYDTKTFDNARFVGANDGGSSTGALLEIARVLQQHPDLAAKTELVFFDGEEAYENFTNADGLFGSRYFAKKLQEQNRIAQFRSGILLDMIGDRSLDVTLPPDSPATLAQGIFASAEALHMRDHFTYASGDILDDHSPLNAVGIPTIDVIDFDYPPWHTPGDTMDKLSAESLQIVGAVTLYYLSQFAFK